MSSDDNVFDPAVHAVDKQGNPSLNKDGSFRKKRSDSGGRSAAKAATSKGVPDYRGTVKDTLDAIGLAVSLVDKVDGATIGAHSESIADACHKTALAEPRFAAAIERMMTASPYAVLIMATAGLGAQLAHNHGIVPAGFMGTTDREVIARQLGVVPKQATEAAEAPRTANADNSWLEETPNAA